MSFCRKLSFRRKQYDVESENASVSDSYKIKSKKTIEDSSTAVSVGGETLLTPVIEHNGTAQKQSEVLPPEKKFDNYENGVCQHTKLNGHVDDTIENRVDVEKSKESGICENGFNIITTSKLNGHNDIKIGDSDESEPKVNGYTDVNRIGDDMKEKTDKNSSIADGELNKGQSDHDTIEKKSSFAIPDGLAMDPMAPTALAVSTEFMDRLGNGLTILRDHGKKIQKYVAKHKFEVVKRSWKSIVNVVLVDAKDLPDGPAGALYCKFKLGTESHKSRAKSKAQWGERFNMHLYEDNSLEVTVWHKGKQKNFMGRCTIDLSQLEKEKTHELWPDLECGYGKLHLLITLSATARAVAVDAVPTTNGVHHHNHNESLPEEDYSWYRLDNSWSEVGQLSVTVYGAKGLSALGISGKADAYCVLELDNSRVQTHTVKGTCDPMWNKTYIFPVNDITSTLDIVVYDESFIASMKCETLGKISIPLLRINNEEKRWYALKDRCRKSGARGNCPRILLQMSVVWNPIKASVRVLRPKEVKYVKKPPKFDIPLIYSNLKFIKDIFNALYQANEHFKRLFEWESQERNTMALVGWITFWHFFRLWMMPLLLLLPFIYNWAQYRSCNNNALVPYNSMTDEDTADEDADLQKDNLTFKDRIYGLQDLTFTIKNGIDYVCSLIERIKNLSNFSVPYLSYFAMFVLLAGSVVLFFVPFSYLMMLLGIYKFTRKLLNPDRVPNNDTLDFLSRVPDDEMLKQWRELKVPEPNLNRTSSLRRR